MNKTLFIEVRLLAKLVNEKKGNRENNYTIHNVTSLSCHLFIQFLSNNLPAILKRVCEFSGCGWSLRIVSGGVWLYDDINGTVSW